MPFPLQTAVGALRVYLGMELPGERAQDAPEEKVLIWGAGGAVGGYAVQYAKSVGYTGLSTSSMYVSELISASDRNSFSSRLRAFEEDWCNRSSRL